MSLHTHTLRKRILDHTSEPYRAAGKFALHFARGKLGLDPVFLAMLERGLFPDNARILDLGCGQGLLAAWLLSAWQRYAFLTRVGNAGAGLGFHLSQWIDATVACCRGMGLPHLHCRPLTDWIQALEALDFHVEAATMNGDLPFANVILIAPLGKPSGSGL
jgi:hypothetical protein